MPRMTRVIRPCNILHRRDGNRSVRMPIKDHCNYLRSASDGHFHFQILELLVMNGANLNITDKRKATALHRAASRGDLAVVSLLIKHGGKELMINSVDAYGNTPLHLACEENNVPVAELLIENGANTEVKNKEEKTPLELARPEIRKSLNRVIGKGN